MIRTSLLVASVLCLGACASTPPAPSKYSLADCDALRGERAAALADQQAAVDKRDGAWKVVIPFAVLGRYAAGASEARAADERLTLLGEHAAARGCFL